MSSPKSNVFDKDDARILSSKNLLRNANRRGRRQIDNSIIWSEDSAYTFASADSGFSNQSEVPEEVYSAEAIMFLGFQEHKANELWAVWVSDKAEFAEDYPFTFIQLITNYVKNMREDNFAGTNWSGLFQNIGIEKELYEKIMDEDFADIRATQSAKYWINDSLETRFAELVAVQTASRKRGEKSRATSSSADSQQNGNADQTDQISGQLNSLSIGGGLSSVEMPRGRQPKVLIGNGMLDKDFVVDGKVTLYKGIDENRIAWAVEDQVSTFRSLISTSPSDFAGTKGVFYFTQHKDTATKYGQFTARRRKLENQRFAIVRLTMPNQVLQSFNPYFVSGDEWKKVIFLSRRGISLDDQGHRHPELRHLDAKPCLFGAIAKGTNEPFVVMNAWTDISGHNMMEQVPLGSGKHASQHVFQGSATVDKLAREGELDMIHWL
jgi:hypothetical protein